MLSHSLAAFLLSALTGLGQPGTLSDATALVARGGGLVEKRLFQQAAAEFEHALDIQPGLYAARYQLAVCLFALGRNDESRREFELLRRQAGPSAQISYYLGRILLLTGDSGGAIRELIPLASNSKIPDADYFIGLAYVAAGDQAKGIEWLERSGQARPGDYHVHYRLARVYAGAGRKSDAEREYDLYKKYRDAERNAEEQLRVCNAALEARTLDKIAESCSHAADPNDSEKLVLLGQLYGEHGYFAEAVEPLRRAAELDPGSFEAWHNLGLSYFRLKRYPAARQALEKAVALRPDVFDTLNLLGATLYVLGDDRAALPVLDRAHQLRPDDAQLKAALERLRNAK
jgi:tetratricopeptide (TPR) repeat protein